MTIYGDPDELDRLAGQIAVAATRVQRQASQVRGQAEGTQWQSTAANEFRGQVDRETAALESTAVGLEQAAVALRAHAAVVRMRLAEIRAIERAVTEWFGRELHALESAARGALHAIANPGEAIRRVVQDPPWSDWPWSPTSLPAPGHRAWLEVGRFMRTQGVL